MIYASGIEHCTLEYFMSKLLLQVTLMDFNVSLMYSFVLSSIFSSLYPAAHEDNCQFVAVFMWDLMVVFMHLDHTLLHE